MHVAQILEALIDADAAEIVGHQEVEVGLKVVLVEGWTNLVPEKRKLFGFAGRINR